MRKSSEAANVLVNTEMCLRTEKVVVGEWKLGTSFMVL